MVEDKLLETLNRIFKLAKTTFNRPSPDAPEQDTLFVEVSGVRSSVRDGMEYHRIEGRAFLFVENEKMPIGFFMRQIQGADPADTFNFHFFNIDGLSPAFMNISQRGFEFVYLYSGQYNPPAGTIETIEFSQGAST